MADRAEAEPKTSASKTSASKTGSSKTGSSNTGSSKTAGAALADLTLLRAAATEGAEIAMAAFRPGAPPKGRLWRKEADGSPLSEADLAVNEALAARLRAARPDYGWLSEEDDDAAQRPARLSAERVFIIDPIDGTRSFARGASDFCVAIAVIEAGRPIAGVIAAPAYGLSFWAAAGAGAAMRAADGAERPLRISDGDGRVDPESLAGLRLLTRKIDLEPRRWRGGRTPPVERGHVGAIALRFARLAEGGHDALLTLRPAHEWDVAAGVLIAQEAGARVTNRHGAPVALNQPQPLVDGILAAAAPLHEAVARRLAD